MSEKLLKLEDINRQVIASPLEFIRISEEKYSKTIETLAENIKNTPNCKIIMLSGPSASGKTTSAMLLSHELKKFGIQAYSVSLDNFYKDQRATFLNEDGSPDFETVYALDLPILEKCLDNILIKGASELPIFDFTIGKRSEQIDFLELTSNDVVIIEGIHALNPRITDILPQEKLVKVYISVSSRIYDNNSDVLLGKRDLRFIRRLVRDYNFRSSTVENTFYGWQSVLKGEEKYLFPYKNNANYFIDSIHSFEPCIFRDYTIPLLEKIAGESIYYQAAQRITNSLIRFESLPLDAVPLDSLMREFV
jgi:uridine kinase